MFPSTAASRQQTSWEKQIASQIIFLVIYTGCVIHTRSDCPKSILKTVSGIRDSHKWCFPHNFESTLTTTQCNQFFRKDVCFSVCVGFKLPLPVTQGHKNRIHKNNVALRILEVFSFSFCPISIFSGNVFSVILCQIRNTLDAQQKHRAWHWPTGWTCSNKSTWLLSEAANIQYSLCCGVRCLDCLSYGYNFRKLSWDRETY